MHFSSFWVIQKLLGITIITTIIITLLTVNWKKKKCYSRKSHKIATTRTAVLTEVN